MNRPSIDKLDAALESLEPRRASAGFTDRVMAELESAGGRARGGAAAPGHRWALAALAAAALIVGILLGREREAPYVELAAESQEIRRQHAELVDELETLRVMAAETVPVLYLGADDDLDLVLDLSELLEVPGSEIDPADVQTGMRMINDRY